MGIAQPLDSSADHPAKTEATRIFEFPERFEQAGTPPMVGYLYNDEPFLMSEAIGRMTFADSDDVALEFRSVVRGQLTEFFQMTLHSTLPSGGYPPELRSYQRVYLRQGSVTGDDLANLGFGELSDLVLGWERGRDQHGVNPFSVVGGPDLSSLTGLTSLQTHAIEFTDEHLMTLGSRLVLQSLRLVGAEVSEASLAKFSNLRALRIDDPRILGSEVRFLGYMSDLFSFGIRFSQIGQSQLPAIAEHRGIRVLDLGYNSRIGPDLSALAGATQLVFLGIPGTAADDTTLASLHNPSCLEALDLQCTKITDDGLGALASFGLVVSLNVAGNRITDHGLHRIVDAMPQLQTIDIRATDVTPEGAMALGRLKNLHTLGLSGNVLTSGLAEHLSRRTSLQQVEVCPPHSDLNEETEAIDIIGGARFVGEPE